MADVTQVERQLHILGTLSMNSRGFSIKEIKDGLLRAGIEVSDKTIQRDLDYITNSFFVYEEKRGATTVYFAKKYCLKNITFTIPELISLHFIKQILNYYNKLDAGKVAAQIIEKIIEATPQINKKYIKSLDNYIKVSVIGIKSESEVKPEYLNLINKAIVESRSLEFDYYAFNKNEIKNRVIDPYLLEIYDGCIHVIGYCRLRKEIRDFRVSRIRRLQLTDYVFQKPERFYENYERKRFNRLSGENEVEIKLFFTGQSARFIEEYDADKADRLEKINGGVLFERKAAMTPEILKWVLSFGSEVQVLAPTSLREDVIGQIKKMQILYNHP